VDADQFDVLARDLSAAASRRVNRRLAVLPAIGALVGLVFARDEVEAEHPVRRVQGGATDAGSMNTTTTTTITSITTSERLVRARATVRTEASNAARPDSWPISAPCAGRSMVDSAQLDFVSSRPSSVVPVAPSTTPNGATSATPTLARAAVSGARPFTYIEPTRHTPSAHSIVRGQDWSAAILAGLTRRLATLL